MSLTYVIDMADQVQEGDKVSWSWNGSNPSGTAAEVKPGEVTVTSHRGNEISKTGDEENPAVHIERNGNDVVKKASELDVEKKTEDSSSTNQNGNEEKDEEKGDKENGEKAEKKDTEMKDAEPEEKNGAQGSGDEVKVGDKRKADEKVDAESDKKAEEEGDDKKKQKTENPTANGTKRDEEKKTETNGENTGEKRRPGRPKGQGNKSSKEKKAPVIGRAERKTRSQGSA